MPIESASLKDKPCPIGLNCPKCGEIFEPFLRGQVQRSPRKFIFFGPRRPNCALICWACKEIIGYE